MANKVRIFDQICGTGKTQLLIKLMANETRPILYITPLLSECHRISGTEKTNDGATEDWAIDNNGDFIIDESSELAHKRFAHPNNRNDRGSKLESLKRLLRQRRNIVSTHVLFKMLTPEIMEYIRQSNYLLICDEAISIYEQYEIEDSGEDKTTENILALINNGFITVHEDNQLSWNYEKWAQPQGSFYEECASLCDMGQLFLINDKAVFMELSIQTFDIFDEVWFATYMFEYSHLCAYLKTHSIEFNIHYGDIRPSTYAHLIELHDDRRLCAIGNNPKALSVSNLKLKDTRDVLSKNLINFFRNRVKVEPEFRIWTTVKEAQKSVGGSRFKGQFVPIGTKATNDYIKVSCAAYLYNGFANPMLKHLLRQREGNFNEDMWALSEMIQWIWRTRIRNNEQIHLYIPSKRMRELFKQWLNDEFLGE